MKKNRVVLSVLAVILVSALFVCSKLEAEIQVLSDRLYTFVVEFPSSIIKHTPITNVSADARILNAKINVDFGCYSSADAKILYYLNGDHIIKEESEKNIPNKQDFFIALPKFSNTDTKVDYQIEVTLKSEGEEVRMYYPVDASGVPYYITSTILSASSSVVNGSEGGTVEYDTGDQESGGGVTVDISSGSYDGDGVITIIEIDPGLLGAPALAPSMAARRSSSKGLKGYAIAKDGDLDAVSNEPITVTIKYPDMKKGEKFVIKRGSSLPATEALETTVNYETKEVTAISYKFGYFVLYYAPSSKNDYRPSRRVIVKSRAESRGDVFQFNCLTDGDVVKIYSVNGKKVRELKGGNFAWDGKNDNGQYVESGTYIYQIKADGKVISGTIAFVK